MKPKANLDNQKMTYRVKKKIKFFFINLLVQNIRFSEQREHILYNFNTPQRVEPNKRIFMEHPETYIPTHI